MSLRLTKLQKQLCNQLQKGLPICPRPFAEIAKHLNCDEKTVLQQTRDLKNAGVIRQLRALINHRTLGIVSTLVAAHIPQESLQEVAEAVNSLDNVSHNYLREHYYNLWFTLQAQTAKQIDVALSNLSGRFGIDFNSLPVKRIFKLAVCFDAESRERVLLQDIERIPERQRIELTRNQKLTLSKLQDVLAITSEPFTFLCGGGLGIDNVLTIITDLIDKGVIRRIAAVLDHRKLGFVANVMFTAEVPQNRIVQAGESLSRSGIVSHCYERKTFENWPYNLFAMMHGRTMGRIQQLINKFIKAEKIHSFQLLPTSAELKKQPVKHKFC